MNPVTRARIVACLISVSVAGCVTLTPRARKIRLLPSSDAQLKHCRELGVVTGQAAAWGQINAEAVDQQAKNNMEDNAAARYGTSVDTVSINSLDRKITKSSAEGIAYQCK